MKLERLLHPDLLLSLLSWIGALEKFSLRQFLTRYSYQLGTHDHIHELRQMVNEKPESCYKTCFTLQHKGKTLDEFAMVHTVEGLVEGETVKCVAGVLQCYKYIT